MAAEPRLAGWTARSPSPRCRSGSASSSRAGAPPSSATWRARRERRPSLLLHGWIASGGLNWFNAFGPLSERYYVVAPDLRGHGRGLRSRRRFRLADCADDVAAHARGHSAPAR